MANQYNDYSSWKDIYVGKVESFCRQYFSAGFKSANDWYIGDIYGAKGDSMQICLSGAKEGKWIDNATDERGNFPELLAKMEGVSLEGNFYKVFTELAGKYLNFSSPATIIKNTDTVKQEEIVVEAVDYAAFPENRIKLKVKRKSVKSIRNILTNLSQPIQGTVAEKYLVNRRIFSEMNITPNICFAKDLIVPCGNSLEAPIKRDAIIFLIKNYEGFVTGIQRVFLTPHGYKIPKTLELQNGTEISLTQKASLGNLTDSFFCIGDDTDMIGVCEGIETAFAIRKLTKNQIQIFATLGAVGLQKFKPSKNVKGVFIFADNDKPGKDAALKLKENLRDISPLLIVKTMFPQEVMPKDFGTTDVEIKDFNDLLYNNIQEIVIKDANLDETFQKCREEIDMFFRKLKGTNVRAGFEDFKELSDIIANHFYKGYRTELKPIFTSIVEYIKSQNKSSNIFDNAVQVNVKTIENHIVQFANKRMNAIALNKEEDVSSFAMHALMDSKPTVEDDAIVVAKELLEKYFLNGAGIIFARSMFYVYGKLDINMNSKARTHWIPCTDKEIEAFCVSYLERIKVNKRLITLASFMAKYIMTKSYKFNEEDPFLTAKSIINCKNGELHLNARTGVVELKAHHYSSYLTYCLDIEYNPQAKCPTFDVVLQNVFVTNKEKYTTDDGVNEKEAKDLQKKRILRLIQMMFGYFIQPNRWLTKFFVWEGRSASNGKSSMIKILTELVGKTNIHQCQFESLEKDFGLAPTVGKLMIIDTDISTAKPLSESMIKKLSENSVNSVNPKNLKQFDAMNTAVPLIVTNNTIKLDETGPGLARRIVMIPFENRFETISESENPVKKIIREEMPGVLNWAVEGFQNLIKNADIFNPELNIRDAKYEKSLDVMPSKIRIRIKQFLDQASYFRIFWQRCHYPSNNSEDICTIATIAKHYRKYLISEGLHNYNSSLSEEDIMSELQYHFKIEVHIGSLSDGKSDLIRSKTPYLRGYRVFSSDAYNHDVGSSLQKSVNSNVVNINSIASSKMQQTK